MWLCNQDPFFTSQNVIINSVVAVVVVNVVKTTSQNDENKKGRQRQVANAMATLPLCTIMTYGY